MSTTRTEVYDRVFSAIEGTLNAGNVPLWDRPWDPRVGMPVSMSTSKSYRGINVFLLGLSQMVTGYTSPWWGTYRKIDELGGQVRKGEKGTMVIFFKVLRREQADASGEVRTNQFGFYRSFTVFNAAQADDLPEKFATSPAAVREHTPLETCEAIIANYVNGPTIHHGGDAAYYSPGADAITMPVPEAFASAEDYYATLFHEETHGTGHKSRLKREGVMEAHRFGDAVYAKEELVAEFGSAMLCGIAGIEKSTIARSASYLDNWRQAISNEPKMLVQAAAAAQKAADFVLGETFEAEDAGDLQQQAA